MVGCAATKESIMADEVQTFDETAKFTDAQSGVSVVVGKKSPNPVQLVAGDPANPSPGDKKWSVATGANFTYLLEVPKDKVEEIAKLPIMEGREPQAQGDVLVYNMGTDKAGSLMYENMVPMFRGLKDYLSPDTKNAVAGYVNGASKARGI